MTDYVVGFAFSEDKVLLIRKNSPAWQAGKLNGVGGKIEDHDKEPVDAMVREFEEETGIKTTKGDWKPVCTMFEHNLFNVHVFKANIDTSAHQSITKEIVGEYLVDDIKNQITISNIPWLLALCQDEDIETREIEIRYRPRF